MKKKKNSKLQKFVQSKGKWALISTGIFALIGITALVVGNGLVYGWASVLAWFGSRWAIYVYIIIGFLGFLVAWIIFKSKMGDE